GKSQQFAIVDNSRAIEQTPPVGVFIRPDRADDGGDTSRFRDDLTQWVGRMRDDVGILKPILRCIAVSRHFGKNHEIRAVAASLFYCLNYLSRVTDKVAVCGVDLRYGDFHQMRELSNHFD